MEVTPSLNNIISRNIGGMNEHTFNSNLLPQKFENVLISTFTNTK